jgi:predicted nuclease with TOPRIM domain
MAITAVAAFLWNKSVVTLVDPLKGADARAREENAVRIRALEAERTALQAELQKIQKENADLQKHMEERLEARITDLRNDPEKLRQAMLEAGRQK